MSARAVFLAISSLFVLAARVGRGDFLNDYLNDKVFGVNPGPCVEQDGSCLISLDSTTFPPEIGGIEFCLIKDAFIVGDLFCQNLEDWVESGTAEIWDVQCEDVGVTDISLTPGSETSQRVQNRLQVENVAQKCAGKTRLQDVVLTTSGITIELTFTGDWSTDPRNNGLDIDFDLVFFANDDSSGSGGFDSNLVNQAEVENCDLGIDLGLTVDNGDYEKLRVIGFNIGVLVTDSVTNLLLRIVEGTFGASVCAILEQAGTLSDGSLGALNSALNLLNEEYDELTEPTDVDIELLDQQFQNNPITFDSSDEELALALDLQDSNAVELVSVTLNKFLGNQDVSPLPINQAIALLTDPDGTVSFDVTGFGVSGELPLNFADAVITLEKVDIVGLDSINVFEILKNDFTDSGDGLKYTLQHEIAMETFQFKLTIKLLLKRGLWVTESSCGSVASGFPSEDVCTSDQEEFTFDFGLTAGNINIKAATLLAANFDEISSIQLGQILDQDLTNFVAAAEAVLLCSAPSIYAFIFSDLEVSIGSVTDPVVENFSGDGLSDLITESTILINTLLKNVLANDLPLLMKGPVREKINEVLLTEVSNVEDVSGCPAYVQVPSTNPYFDFTTAPVEAIFPVINDVLGDFEAGSDVDANDLVQVLMDYYSESSEVFPLESTGTTGDWDTKPNLTPVVTLPAFVGSFEDSANAFLQLADFKLRNLDTITGLLSDSREAFENGFFVDVVFGGTGSELLELSYVFDFQASGLGVSDKFSLVMSLEDVRFLATFDEFLINGDALNRLRFEQLLHLPCVTSVLDGIVADTRKSLLSAGDVNFEIVYDGPASSSALGVALEELQTELQAASSSVRFTRTMNYFLGVGFELGLTSLKDADYSATPESCDEIESGLESLLNLFTGLDLPNVTFLTETCLANITELEPLDTFEQNQLGYSNSPNQLDGDFLDLEENFFAGVLSRALNLRPGGDGDASAIQNLIILLANSTGNLLSDILVLEEDEETVSLELTLNEANDLLELLQLEPLSVANDEGFLVEVQKVRVTGINKFLNDFRLFQPISSLTTSHRVGFQEENPLQVEIIVLLEANATIVSEDDINSPPIQEEIIISLDLLGVTFELDLLTAIQADKLIELSVAHFLTVDAVHDFGLTDFATSCFFRNFYDNGFNIRNFQIQVDNVVGPTVSAAENNILSPGVESVLREVSAVLGQFYVKAIPNICQNCIRVALNDALQQFVVDSKAVGACPETVDIEVLSESDEILRFSDSGNLAGLQQILTEQFYTDDYALWNTFIAGLTSETLFDTTPFDTGEMTLLYKDVDYGALQIIVSALDIVDLDTFTKVKLLEPRSRDDPSFNEEVDPYRVTLAFDIEGKSTFITDANIIGNDLFTQAPVVENNVKLGLGITDLSFALDMVLEVNLTRLMRLQFNQVDSFDELPCLFVPISAMTVQDFNLSTGNISISADCIGQCDAELLDNLAVTGAFNSENDEELSELFNVMVRFIVAYVESSPADRLINVALETSEETCSALVGGLEGLLEPGPETLNVFQTMLYLFLGGTGIGLLVLAYQYPVHKKRKAARVKKFKERQKKFAEDDELILFENELKSLSQSGNIPLHMKVIIPLICVLNIVGLAIAILSQGALTIIINFVVLGMETTTIRLVPLTLVSTINDMWVSGAWPIAILVGGASCAWPVVKNMLLLFLWYSPATIIPKNKRYRYLELLDVAGKWSLVDVFVVVVTLSALFTYVTLSEQEQLQFLDPLFFEVLVTVQPENGIVILSSVAAISLLVNHVMAYYHQKTVHHHRKEYDRIAKNPSTPPKLALARRSLSQYRFYNRAVSPKAMKALMALNVVSGLLVLVGVFLPVLTFELNGLVGLLLTVVDDAEKVRTYSIVDLGVLISAAPSDSAYQGFVVILFQFLFFFVSVLAPILQCLLQGILLAKRFNVGNLETVLEVTMISSFWSALDVVLVGIIATIIEVRPITIYIVDFITGDICSNVKPVLEVLVPGEVDDSCLDVIGSMEITIIPLFLGVAGQAVVLVLTTVLANRVYQDRYYHSYVGSGLRPRENKPPKLGFLRGKLIKMMTVPIQRNRQAAQETPSRDVEDVQGQTAAEDGSSNERQSRRPKTPLESALSAVNPMFDNADDAGSDAQVLRPSDDIFSEMEQENRQIESQVTQERLI